MPASQRPRVRGQCRCGQRSTTARMWPSVLYRAQGSPSSIDRVRLVRDFPGTSHRMPAVAQRRVRVGEGARHSVTLVRPGPRRQGHLGRHCDGDPGVLKRGTVDAAAQATKEHPPPGPAREWPGVPGPPAAPLRACTTRRFLVLAVAIGGCDRAALDRSGLADRTRRRRRIPRSPDPGLVSAARCWRCWP